MWEYKLEKVPVTAPLGSIQIAQAVSQLDKMGADGWEAVSMILSPHNENIVLMLFKRHSSIITFLGGIHE